MAENARKDRFSLENFPNLHAYITRVGAVQLHYRKYVIREPIAGTAYYNEKAWIRISESGEITCDDPQHAPTEDVAELIKREIQSVNDWPRSILFSERQVRQLEYILQSAGNTVIYRFHMRGGKLRERQAKENAGDDSTMIMCQVRYNRDDGGKDYKPWTYYSDGQWRCMEPDGDLPFFKQLQKKNEIQLMIHEGPKAAMAAQKLVEDYENGNSDHPWAHEFSQYEHWGIIGGAKAVKRADFGELSAENYQHVVFFCDNDPLGKASAIEFSQKYRRIVSVVSLDDRWKYGWDIADPLPEAFFTNGEYTGPTLDSLMHSATWATRIIPSPDGKKPSHELTPGFSENWIFCVKPFQFINRLKPSVFLNEEEFNNKVRSISDVKKTSDLVINTATCKVDALMYDPSKPAGIYNTGTNNQDSVIKFNTHVPSSIVPRAGDDKMWHEYLEHMFPDEEDRFEVKRWVATLISRPDIKINYALLLISEQQGVGKSTLSSYILSPILGQQNVSWPEESTIVDSRFTTWQVRKRLAVVNEIYAGHSYKAYNKLKSVITEPLITVEEKYVANYEIDNWCHIFACSNDERAIKFTMDDRRWLVPRVTEKKWPISQWDRLHSFLKHGGLNVIRQWADDFLAADPTNVISRGEGAPMTRRKKSVYETMLSDGERLVLDRLLMVREAMFERNMLTETGDLLPYFVAISDLREMIRHTLHPNSADIGKVESAYRLKKLLKANGYHTTDTMVTSPGGSKTYLIGNTPSTLVGTFGAISRAAKQIRLHSDDPAEVSLQMMI